MSDTVALEHPDPDKRGARVHAGRYEAMKAALLRVVPRSGEGVPFGKLAELVEPELPDELFRDASVKWYVVSVKLDLEARGLLRRVPGSRPQRVLRT